MLSPMYFENLIRRSGLKMLDWPASKVAVTVAALETWHVPVPLHPPPLHPVKVDPPAGEAVSVTAWSKSCEHVPPQLMPAGDDVTVPDPVPFLFTVTVNVVGPPPPT